MEGQFKKNDSIDRRAYPTTTTFFWVAMMTASGSERQLS
jgi:hypothetical protein